MGVQNNILLVRSLSGNLERLFFTPNKKISSTTVDVIFNYKYKNAVRLTENPVEQGFNVNDHRIITPNVVILMVGTSNTVTPDTIVNSGFDQATILSFGKQILFNGRADSSSRSAATYQSLLTDMNNGQPFDIETPMFTFKNMLIIDIEQEQNAENINTFQGTVTLQEMITFQTQQLSNITQKAGVVDPVNGGQKNPTPSTASVATKARGLFG